MPSAFISYSRRDKDFVQRLHDALAAREFEVWVDFEDIPPSAQWLDEIRAGLLSADGVVFVISPDSVASEVCLQELEHAAQQHKRIVPVMHRDPGSTPVPEIAAALNWVFLRDGDDFDAGIDALVMALETDLEHVRTHTRLGIEAERWAASDRDRSRLLRGSALAGAEAWLVAAGDKEPQPTQLQREYLLASRQAATRRQRVVIGGVSLGLLVAIGLGILALISRNDAIHARDAAQAALDDTKALSNYTSDPQRSVADAVRAIGIVASPSTEEALREALTQSHLRMTFNASGSAKPDAIWSPDGTRLLVTSPGLTTKIYRPGTSARPVNLPAPPFDGDVAWDAKGDRVLVGGAQPGVYDAATGRLIAHIPGPAYRVALSSRGTLAATTDVDSAGHWFGTVFDVASGRTLATFHPAYAGGVTCFAWAPDDSVIAQCDAQSTTNTSSPGSLDLWDPSTGRLLHSDHAKGFVGSVAFSPDSSLYAYATTNLPPNEKTLAQQLHADVLNSGKAGTFVYRTRTGALVKSFPQGASVVSFSPSTVDGVELAYATLDAVGHVYNFAAGTDEPLVGATSTINAISFSSSGAYVVTGSDDGMGRVYDGSDGNLLETLADGETRAVLGASFGLDDASIATTAGDGIVRLWTTPVPQPRSHLRLTGDLRGPTSAHFSTDGSAIVESGLLGAGEILEARSLRLVSRFAAPPGYEYLGAVTSRDGRLVAAVAYRVVGGAFADGLVETFDARTGRLLATMRPPPGVTLASAYLDQAGDRLAMLYTNGDAQEWDPRSGTRLQLLRGRPPAETAAYSPDGSTLAIVHEPRTPSHITLSTTLGVVTIDLWNARSGQLMREIEGPNLTLLINGVKGVAPISLAFSPNSKAIALAGADDKIYSWATQSPVHIGLAIPGGEFATSLAFSPNSQMLAAGTASGAYVYDLHTGQPKAVFQHANPSEFTIQAGYGVQVGFTHDSRILVTVGDNALKAWDIADHLQLFDGFTGYGHGALNPAGTEFVVAAGPDLFTYPCDLCGGLTELLAVAKRTPTS